MVAYVLIAAVLALPVGFGLFFRVGAPHIFFSVMAGELLARSFGHDVEHALVQHTTLGYNVVGYSEVALLALPVLFTALFLKGSVSHGKSLLNIAPLIVTGVVFAAFALPVLPAAARELVAGVPLGKQLLDVSGVIIGVVVILQLVALWLLNRGEGKKHGRKKKD